MPFRRFAILSAALLPTVADAEIAAPPDLGSSVFSMIFGLAVVLALLFASLWLLKRLSAPRGQAAGLMRVVAGTAVGTRERVVVLEVAGTWLVLGVAPGRITALAQMPREDLPVEPEPGRAGNFASRLKQIIDRHAR